MPLVWEHVDLFRCWVHTRGYLSFFTSCMAHSSACDVLLHLGYMVWGRGLVDACEDINMVLNEIDYSEDERHQEELDLDELKDLLDN